MTPYLLSALSAFLLACAFPPVGIGPVAFIALVPLKQAIDLGKRQEAFKIGFLWGLVFFSTLIWWLIPTISHYGQIPIVLAMIIFLCLCCYLAIYPGLWSLFFKIYCPPEQSPLITALVAASAWTLLEALRAQLFSGFPWGNIAYSLTHVPILIQTADIWSVWGIDFLICFTGMAIAAILAPVLPWQNGQVRGAGENKSNLIAMLLIIALQFALLASYGWHRLNEYDERAELASNGTTLVAGAVQASINQNQKWDPAYMAYTFNRYLDLTSKAKEKDKELRLVVWPETAMPFYFQERSRLRQTLLNFAATKGLYILFGSPFYIRVADGIRYLNSAFLIGPEGRVLGRYDKQHLVPFGEYMPWGPLTSWAKGFLPTAGDFIPGNKARVLKGKDVAIGTMICFESIFPEISRQEVKKGANILAVITNDAWFGNTSAPYQHADMAIFRAVETRRWLIRAANTGISRIIAPSGRIVAQTDLFVPQFITGRVRLEGGRTFYCQHGQYWFLVFNILIIIFGCYNATKCNRKEKKE